MKKPEALRAAFNFCVCGRETVRVEKAVAFGVRRPEFHSSPAGCAFALGQASVSPGPITARLQGRVMIG